MLCKGITPIVGKVEDVCPCKHVGAKRRKIRAIVRTNVTALFRNPARVAASVVMDALPRSVRQVRNYALSERATEDIHVLGDGQEVILTGSEIPWLLGTCLSGNLRTQFIPHPYAYFDESGKHKEHPIVAFSLEF